MKKDKSRVKGKVIEVFSGGKFKVELKDGKEIRAYLSGKMRMNHIQVLPGDKVTVETTPYDPGKGRIFKETF